MAIEERFRSPTSVCLKIVEPWFAERSPAEQRTIVRQFADLLESEGVAFDMAGHRTAPPGLRVWCGPTVESDKIEALTPWRSTGHGPRSGAETSIRQGFRNLILSLSKG